MQRNNNSAMRTVFLVCLFVTVLLAFLYIMKRIEVNKVYRDIEIMKVERRELEEDLNSKLNDHLEKIESLTQEVGQLQSRLSRCEDEKAASIVESDKAKKEREQCMIGQEDLQTTQKDLQDGYNQLKGDHERASSQLSKVNQELDSLRASLASSQGDSQSAKAAVVKCEDELGQCQLSVDGLNKNLLDCKNSCPGQQGDEVNNGQGIVNEPEEPQAEEVDLDDHNDAEEEEESKSAGPLYEDEFKAAEQGQANEGQANEGQANELHDNHFDFGEAPEVDKNDFNLEAAINDYLEENIEPQQL